MRFCLFKSAFVDDRHVEIGLMILSVVSSLGKFCFPSLFVPLWGLILVLSLRNIFNLLNLVVCLSLSFCFDLVLLALKEGWIVHVVGLI